MDILDHDDRFYVVSVAGSVDDILASPDKDKVDIVFMDIELEEGNGIALVRKIKRVRPDAMVVIMTNRTGGVYSDRAMRAGASGYLSKKITLTSFWEVTGRLLGGEKVVTTIPGPQPVSGTNDNAVFNLDILNDHELETFMLIGRGFNSNQIAEKLHLKVNTIDKYKTRIKTKFRFSDVKTLRQFAVEWVNRHQPAGFY